MADACEAGERETGMGDERSWQRGDISRRTLLRHGVGALGAGIAGLVGMSRRVPHALAADVTTMDTCSWQNVGAPFCSGGRKYQKRCEVCCAGGVCETVRCVFVDVGSC